jgi:hypothetical protein
MAPPFVSPSSLQDPERYVDGDDEGEPPLWLQLHVAITALCATDFEEFIKGTCQIHSSPPNSLIWLGLAKIERLLRCLVCLEIDLVQLNQVGSHREDEGLKRETCWIESGRGLVDFQELHQGLDLGELCIRSVPQTTVKQ